MNIYSDIDLKATAKNVDKFLSKQLPHIMLRCGHSITELSSPKLTLTSASTSSRTDIQESIIVNAMELDHVVQAVHSSILACCAISRTILIERYILNYEVNRVVMDIPYERNCYYHTLKPKSLNEFADIYSGKQLQSHVSKENLIDLHIYED